MELAPIALFAFNRPDHLRRTVEALKSNDIARLSHLSVFCDGPRDAADAASVEEVRQIAAGISGFASVEVVTRDENAGLAGSITAGVTQVCQAAGSVIVVEDDLDLSPHFLRFLNDGLTAYRDDTDVVCISGFMYPHREQLPETFFMRGAYSLGWATWKRGWDVFEPDAAKLLQQIRERHLRRAFDVTWYPYTAMLELQAQGKLDSWAIRWYASAFLAEKLTLFPAASLVRHMGFDGTGTNIGITDDLEVPLATAPVEVGRMPTEASAQATRAFKAFLRRRRLKDMGRRLLRRAP